jgi:hypothetical protein
MRSILRFPQGRDLGGNLGQFLIKRANIIGIPTPGLLDQKLLT